MVQPSLPPLDLWVLSSGNFLSKIYPWQISFFIGGGLGLLLLIARVSVFESGMFLKTKEKHVQRGNFFQLFTKKTRFLKFIGCIFIGLADMVYHWYTDYIFSRICESAWN